MLLEVYSSGPAQTNTILLGCSKTHYAAIIDAPPSSANILIDRIKKLGLHPQMILLTHSHWDHLGDVAQLKREFNIPVHVHELDAKNLRAPGSDGLPLMFEIEGVEPDYYLKDGDKLALGDLSLEVIHTPGHSPGGVCFYIEKENLLVSGDTLFKGTIGNISFPESEPEKMWSSLKRLAQLPNNTRVIPGHGGETSIGDENWLINAQEYFGG